jgi:hypothetical protein
MNFTSDDFRNIDLNEAIDDFNILECEELSSLFFMKSREITDEDDIIKKNIFTFLGDITSMYLHPDSKTEPFRPLFTSRDKRSAKIDDFTSDQLKIMSEIIDELSNSDLKARFADVIWIINKEYRFVEIAIDSYLSSSNILINKGKHHQAIVRLERAINLATSLGKQNKNFDKVKLFIEDIIDKYNSDGNNERFIYGLIKILFDKKTGDPTKYAQIIEKIAEKTEEKGDLFSARDHWELAANWYLYMNDNDNQRKALLNAAKTLVKQADSAVSKMNASTHLSQAIEAYRRIGNCKDIVEELHQKLLMIEKESLNEMQKFSTKVDFSKEAKFAIEQVKGRNQNDAIFQLALLLSTSKIEDLEKEVKESINTSPLLHIIGAMKVDESGKVVGRKPSLLSKDPNESEEAMNAEMFNHAEFNYFYNVKGIIEPARQQIMSEHHLRLQDLSFIVSNNPFIPEGREFIYAKGLHAGFEGDFLISTHLLIPQVENSIRYILSQQGIITSGISSDGIQDEKSLNTILSHEKTKEIFGKDLLFDLKGLLVERYGSNIRNLMAHGLMHYHFFYSHNIIFFWGLILRICCWPILIKRNYNKINASQNNENAC